jgi:hypothetical protein
MRPIPQVSRLLLRLIICTFIVSLGTWLGCSSDVGTASSAKSDTAAFLAKEADKMPTTRNKKGGPSAKSIKTKVFKDGAL